MANYKTSFKMLGKLFDRYLKERAAYVSKMSTKYKATGKSVERAFTNIEDLATFRVKYEEAKMLKKALGKKTQPIDFLIKEVNNYYDISQAIVGDEFTPNTKKLLKKAELFDKYRTLPTLDKNGVAFTLQFGNMLSELNNLGFGSEISPMIFGS